MADNFLEKQMEAYRSGKTVIRRTSPSLDTLLRRVEDQSEAAGEKVMQAQLDAVVRSASILKDSATFSFDASEERQSIIVHGPSSPRRQHVALGRIVLAMELKATELGLGSEAEMTLESASAAAGLTAMLKLRK